MALFPAVTLNFDGVLPYADDGTSDSSGVFHAHKIKRGSTSKLRLTFPSIPASGGDVDDYFWVMHMRTSAGAATTEVLLRSRATTFTTPTNYTPTERSGIDRISSGTIELDIHSDDCAQMSVQSNGAFDIEAYKWINPSVPTFNAIESKDRAVKGIFHVTQDVTRELTNAGDVAA